MTMKSFFEGKVAVVTGASSGIGKAIAKDLIKNGAKVALMARGVDKLQEVAKDLGEEKTLVCPADVVNPEDVQRVAENITNHFGQVNILVNCAGTFQGGSFLDLNIQTIQQMMEVNFQGTVNCLKIFLPQMIKAGEGYVVNMSSLAGKIPVPGASAYCASKYAVGGLSNNIRQELKPAGVHVIAVYPSYVDTPILSGHIDSLKQTPFYRLTSNLSPEKVSSTILKGIWKRKRELLFPSSSFLLVALYGICPNMMDNILGKFCGGWPTPTSLSSYHQISNMEEASQSDG